MRSSHAREPVSDAGDEDEADAAHDGSRSYRDGVESLGRRDVFHRHDRADNPDYAGDVKEVTRSVVEVVGREAQEHLIRGIGLESGGNHAHDDVQPQPVGHVSHPGAAQLRHVRGPYREGDSQRAVGQQTEAGDGGVRHIDAVHLADGLAYGVVLRRDDGQQQIDDWPALRWQRRRTRAQAAQPRRRRGRGGWWVRWWSWGCGEALFKITCRDHCGQWGLGGSISITQETLVLGSVDVYGVSDIM